MGLIPKMTFIQKQNAEYVKRVQNRRFRKMLRYAISKSSFYRELYRGIDIKSCKVEDLPVITKQMMMDNFDDFVTDKRLKRAELRKWLSDKNNLGKMYLNHFIPFQTSGTTGENALIVYNRKSMDWVHSTVIARQANYKTPSLFEQLVEMLRAVLFKKLRMAAVVMTGGPYPAYTAALYAPKAHDFFVQHKTYSLFDPIDSIVKDLNEHQPDQMISYPSILEVLAREQIAGRLKLKFDHKFPSLAAGSEPLSTTTKKLAKEAWGLDIQDTYGTSECFIMARSCDRFDRMHVMNDLCIFEVVDRHHNPVPDGQMGEKVLVTNLFNYTQPFIRYEVSDVTGYSTEPCDCDWPFPVLLPVEGRTDDIYYIDRPGGGYEPVHPYLFLGPIVELDEVREYQLAQTGRNEVTFRFVPIASATEAESTIKKVLLKGMEAAHLADRVTLKLEKVGKIARHPKSGKFRQIVSEVGAPENLDEKDIKSK